MKHKVMTFERCLTSPYVFYLHLEEPSVCAHEARKMNVFAEKSTEIFSSDIPFLAKAVLCLAMPLWPHNKSQLDMINLLPKGCGVPFQMDNE